MISRRLAVWLFLVGGCWLLSIPAQATSYTWAGSDATNPTDWETAANWSPNGVPGTADSAIIGQNQTVAVSTDIQVDSLSMDAGSTVTGSGSVTVLSSFQATDVILDGTGVLTFAEGCHAEFRTNSPPNSSQKTKSRKKISNKGKAYLESGDLILSADFDNGSNGIFYADADGAINWTGTKQPRFTNSGKFVRAKGAGTASITIPFTNTGTVVAQAGVLDLGPNYTQNGGTTTLDGGTISSATPLQFNGGVLAGTGVIKGSVVNSGGHVAPGHSPGAITILGNFTQTSGGTLDMQIAGVDPGVEYDQISVQGTATLAGTLNITWLNNYQPSVGDSFTLLEYFSCSGSFSNVAGFTRPNKIYLATSTTPSYYLATAALDNQLPTIAMSSPTANALLTGQFPAVGTASDAGSGLTRITARLYRLATATTPAGYWNGTSWDATYNPATHERTGTGRESWTVALPKLASGKYNIRATATDAVQNATSSPTVAFTVDNTPPPTLTITSPVANAFLTRLPQFKGTAADDINGSGIQRVDLFLRRVSTNTFWTGSAWGARTALKTSFSSGNWASSFTLPAGASLPDDNYELTAQAFDGAGWSKSLLIKVTVDVTPPVVAIKSPLALTVVKALSSTTGTSSDNLSGLSSLAVRLTRYAGGGVTAGYWNGTSWDATYSATKHELPVTVAANWSRALLTDPATRLDAKYNIRVTARDKSGNSATTANDFWVDAGLPQSVTIDTPALGSFVTKLASVAGTAVDSPGGQGISRTDLQIRRASDSLFWNGTGWQSAAAVLTTTQVASSWSRTHSSSTPLPSGATLPDGKYTLTATTYDKALNSKTVSGTVTIDATAPAVAITAPLANANLTHLAALQGTASDATAGVAKVTVRLYRYKFGATVAGYWNGASGWTTGYDATLNEIPAIGTTSWSLTLPVMSEAKYFAIATVTDKSGNKTVSPTFYFNIDTSGPGVSFTSPAPGALVKALAALNGKATDAIAGVAHVDLQIQRPDGLFWNGSAWVASATLTTAYTTANGTWSCNQTLPIGTNLPEGVYTLTATAFDTIGNSSSAVISSTVDKTLPLVSVQQPLPGAYQSVTQVSGTASDDQKLASVTLRLSRSASGTTAAGYWNGTTWDAAYSAADERPVTGLGNWSIALPALADGLYTVRATAKDAAGNGSTSPGVTFTIDATAPETITIDIPSDGATLSSLGTLSGTAKDSGSGVASVTLLLQRDDGLFWTGSDWGNATSLVATYTSTGSWTYSTNLPSGANLPDAGYTLTATVTDKAGNTNSAVSQFTVAAPPPPALRIPRSNAPSGYSM